MVKWIALLLALVPATASAGFINKKSDWDRTSQDYKFGYIMGLYDFQMTVHPGNEDTLQYYEDVNDCVIELELRAGDLIAIVDKGYEELENWERPPVAVFLGGIRRVCLANINRARAARGEELLEQ